MAPSVTCDCGTCKKCRHRVYMRSYYHRPKDSTYSSGGKATVVCLQCEQVFETTVRQINAGRRYCSRRCKIKAQVIAKSRATAAKKAGRCCEECGDDISQMRKDTKWCSLVCANAHRRREHPEERRRHDLKKKYGLTIKEYDELWRMQGEECAICGISENGNGYRMAVDHDHETGAVRGILCAHCNLAIGKFDHDPERLTRAAEYLARPIGRTWQSSHRAQQAS